MSDMNPVSERPILAKIFVSPDEPRLRAGWRLLVQLLLMIVIGIVVSVIAWVVGVLEDSATALLNQFFNFLVITGSVYIARRWLDKRSFESLGLTLNRETLIDILTGVGITFVQIGFIFVVMLSLGWLTFERFAWDVDPLSKVITSVAIAFVAFTFVSWNEELLSRGYHLQTIASGLNLFWGVIISSAVFGLLHIFNPNATWVSAAGIFFAGLFLAYGYLRTRQLWLPIGLHLGWNFFEGVGFGFPVSGLDIYALTRIQVHGPELWTGGAFGPEAGLIVLPALLLGAGLIYLYTRNRTGAAL